MQNVCMNIHVQRDLLISQCTTSTAKTFIVNDSATLSLMQYHYSSLITNTISSRVYYRAAHHHSHGWKQTQN